jgi:hypothetical protein
MKVITKIHHSAHAAPKRGNSTAQCKPVIAKNHTTMAATNTTMNAARFTNFNLFLSLYCVDHEAGKVRHIEVPVKEHPLTVLIDYGQVTACPFGISQRLPDCFFYFFLQALHYAPQNISIMSDPMIIPTPKPIRKIPASSRFSCSLFVFAILVAYHVFFLDTSPTRDHDAAFGFTTLYLPSTIGNYDREYEHEEPYEDQPQRYEQAAPHGI